MKTLAQHIAENKALHQNVNIAEKLKINKGCKSGMLKPQNVDELKKIIIDRYKENSQVMDLTDVDVSTIKDFMYVSPHEEYGLFYFMYLLEELDVTGWETSQATNMKHMFDSCKSLKKIKGIENWDVSNVKNVAYMFYDCANLTNDSVGDLKNWTLNKSCVTMSMFSGSHIAQML